MDARILLVDDDPAFLGLSEPIVNELADGIASVTAVEGPRQALEVLEAWAIGGVNALVITDYIMPDMTGMDLIQASRELHPDSNFQYACLTTVFHRTVLARTQRAGAVRAEVKPNDMNQLAEILESITSPWLRCLEEDAAPA